MSIAQKALRYARVCFYSPEKSILCGLAQPIGCAGFSIGGLAQSKSMLSVDRWGTVKVELNPNLMRQALTSSLLTSYYDSTIPASRSDRKSTRLNSSHVAISYAVFCLKKKRQRARER